MSELTDLIVTVAGGNLGLALLILGGYLVDGILWRLTQGEIEDVETRIARLETKRMSTDGGRELKERETNE